MKTMKKLTALVLTVLLLFSLASCRATGPISYFEYEPLPTSNNYTAAAKIGELEEFQVSQKSGNLILFQKTLPDQSIYKVLNMKTGSYVKTLDDLASDADTYAIILKPNYFTVQKIQDSKVVSITLHDINGQVIATDESATPADISTLASDELLLFADKLYEVDPDTRAITLLSEVGKFNLLRSVNGKIGDYLCIDMLDLKNSLVIVDKTGVMISSYTRKTEYDLEAQLELANGSILFQYTELLSSNASSYDYVEINKISGKAEELKYNIISEIFDPKTGSVTQVDTEFIIDDISHYNEDNLLCIYEIENHKLSETMDYVFSDNNLKIKSRISESFDSFEATMIFPLSETIYSAVGRDGLYRLVTKDGKVLKTLSQNDYYTIRGNLKGDYFYTDDAIYKLADLSVVYDLKTEKKTVIGATANCFILNSVTTTENGTILNTYYRFDGQNLTTIFAAGDPNYADKAWGGYLSSINCYLIAEKDPATGKYNNKVYSVGGTLLTTIEQNTDVATMPSVSVVHSYNGFCVMQFDGMFYLFL